jgi:diacylglycerol kinase family enzyme
LVLVNPTRRPSNRRLLHRSPKYRFTVIQTRDKHHLVEETKKFLHSSYRHLLIWGGDGTVHQVINALLKEAGGTGLLKEKSIGFFRGGTGNGIQDSYEIPSNLTKQLQSFDESIIKGYEEPVDIVQIDVNGKRYFGQLFGLGFDAELLRLRQEKGSKPGILRYLKSGVAAFFSFPFSSNRGRNIYLRKGKYALRARNINAEYPFNFLSRPSTAAMIEVGTRPYYGKKFKICPDVVCNDGMVDAYFFRILDRWIIPFNILDFWTGRHDRINQRLARKERPIIERYEVEEIEIELSRDEYFHIDGELYRSSYDQMAKISILPRALRFLVPRTFYAKFHPFDHDALE